IAKRRGEDVEAFGSGRRYRWLAQTVRSAQGESASADGAGLSDYRHSGDRPRRLLDPPDAAVRRDREPRGRRRVDPDLAPRSAGEDRPDRWRDPGAHPDGLQAWRAAGVFDGQGADAAGGGPPARLPRAPDASGERVTHVNRTKGLLFAQGVLGYQPLRKARREQLEELRTGDGRPLPVHLMAQIVRELDRLEVVLEQLKTVEAERNALLKPATGAAASPPAMLLELKGIGPETAAVLWSERRFRQ